MKRIIIDGSKIESKTDIHSILARELDFPSWYGNNLDALYDCLTDISEECEIVIENDKMLEAALKGQYKGFMRVLETAANSAGKIRIIK